MENPERRPWALGRSGSIFSLSSWADFYPWARFVPLGRRPRPIRRLYQWPAPQDGRGLSLGVWDYELMSTDVKRRLGTALHEAGLPLGTAASSSSRTSSGAPCFAWGLLALAVVFVYVRLRGYDAGALP